MATQTLVPGGDAGRWDQAIYDFLAEKERRSGSMRTVRAYSGMLYRFFGTLGKPTDQVVATEIFSYAHGTGPSGKKPSSVTIVARIACLSSFYRFLIRMSLVAANPCDELERPNAKPAPPRGLTAVDIKKLLDVMPRYSSRISGPGHHPDFDPHWPTPLRGTEPQSRRPDSGRGGDLLQLPWQGR